MWPLSLIFVLCAVGARSFWNDVYEMLKDQGSLIGGLLALAAGGLAYRAGLQQVAATRAQNDHLRTVANQDRESRLAECRAVLQMPIARLLELEEVILVRLSGIVESAKTNGGNCVVGKESVQFPSVEGALIEMLGRMIPLMPAEDATALNAFVITIQVQTSRLDKMSKQVSHVPVTFAERDLLAYVADALGAYAYGTKLLKFARRSVDAFDALTPEELHETAQSLCNLVPHAAYGIARYLAVKAKRDAEREAAGGEPTR